MKRMMMIFSVMFVGLGLIAPHVAQAAEHDKLSSDVAKLAGISQEQAQASIQALWQVIEQRLKDGQEVPFRGFGKFYAQSRDARQGRNPKTGEAISIPAKRYPKFTSSAAFKDRLNKITEESGQKVTAPSTETAGAQDEELPQ